MIHYVALHCVGEFLSGCYMYNTSMTQVANFILHQLYRIALYARFVMKLSACVEYASTRVYRAPSYSKVSIFESSFSAQFQVFDMS